MLLGLFALGAPRDSPYNIAFRCGCPCKVKHATHFRARRLPGEMSASGQDVSEEPLPLHLLMQIVHFRASRLSAQISASGPAPPEEAFLLQILLQIGHFRARRLCG